MKQLLFITILSLGLVACGGGSGGSDSGSGGTGGGTADHRLGTYTAEIHNLDRSVIFRTLDILVESDQAITSGTPEAVPFIQVRDGDNIWMRYRYLRNTVGWPANNMMVESDYETESVYYYESSFDSLADCLSNTAGTGAVYERITINSPKFSSGGSGTYLSACKLKD